MFVMFFLFIIRDVNVSDAEFLNISIGLYEYLLLIFVPVECMFSTTGLVANSKRSSLSAEKLHRITRIHDNFKFISC